jgi:AmiR/NasT family two-component response regulator
MGLEGVKKQNTRVEFVIVGIIVQRLDLIQNFAWIDNTTEGPVQALVDRNKDKLFRKDVNVLPSSPRSDGLRTILFESSVEMRCEEMNRTVLQILLFAPDPNDEEQ